METNSSSLINDLLQDQSIPHYPSVIKNSPEFSEQMNLQFGDIIGKKLKKKLQPV
jgi:hypothetical protein